MPWDFGAGVAAAAGAGAGLIGDSIKRERDLQGAADLLALKEKVEQDKQARIAAIIGGVSRTKTVDVADESGGHTVEQAKPEGEFYRERGDALTKAGLIDSASKEFDRAEKHDDRHELRTTQAAKQKSDDEKWRMTFAETKRFHDETLKRQSQQLGLKAKEAKDFESAVDSYMTNKAQYEMLRAEKGNDPDLIAAAKQGMESDALKLKQFRVDVGDTSDFAKRLNLSATLTSLNKTIDDINADPATVVKAKAARDSVIEQMASLTSGKGDGEVGGKPQDVRVGGKVIGQATTQAEADALVAAYKKKGPPAQFKGVEANLLRPEYGKDGMIQTRETL